MQGIQGEAWRSHASGLLEANWPNLGLGEGAEASVAHLLWSLCREGCHPPRGGTGHGYGNDLRSGGKGTTPHSTSELTVLSVIFLDSFHLAEGNSGRVQRVEWCVQGLTSIRATPWDLLLLHLGSFGCLVARGSSTGAADLTVQTELHELVTRTFLINGDAGKEKGPQN